MRSNGKQSVDLPLKCHRGLRLTVQGFGRPIIRAGNKSTGSLIGQKAGVDKQELYERANDINGCNFV